ncbi:hypothetical protein BRADI_4g13556v3 [Brachypodium distachyon]|uniref:Uncharacterized protein n=1 Tax=Brachypodium distachyon TaxID=15368 RepID=A0A2K2CMM0_BRADI|nr:hypothetical protein BRADI_4g13556v3 [Brachypodium distachyon]PNT63261.1 hypothetical protein BRADI_4g13556v3 [Brachypodium distachyon]PNT63262.1 hypothetical protein BRADI_4g13556v3 [Brachypodium distachyon]PNT63263.1 hypothetical protein BRADI_4g13556v3 [Brachypodium distachyon]PNT63264.1 hypothetical protein BRADI_4g13556v3 [Brachypodium distachyon]
MKGRRNHPCNRCATSLAVFPRLNPGALAGFRGAHRSISLESPTLCSPSPDFSRVSSQRSGTLLPIEREVAAFGMRWRCGFLVSGGRLPSPNKINSPSKKIPNPLSLSLWKATADDRVRAASRRPPALFCLPPPPANNPKKVAVQASTRADGRDEDLSAKSSRDTIDQADLRLPPTSDQADLPLAISISSDVFSS